MKIAITGHSAGIGKALAKQYEIKGHEIIALLNPTFLNIRNLPEDVLNSVKIELQNRINQNPGYLLEDSYRNMLHYIDLPFEKNIELSLDKLSKLDQRRGINSKTIFKDLYKDINHG